MAEERGRAARFFEGFANALLERALPRVREWLQGRFGPGADVGAIRLEGREVHVDDTRVPLGPRATLSIARATFRVTGEAARPLTLHALSGEVHVPDGGFVAPVRFDSAREVRSEAWIEGTLRVERATWPRVDGAGEQAPLDGSLDVFVTSDRWTLERGAFTCGDARITIEAEGDLDATGAKRLGRARIVLSEARAAHFADAALAITGARMSGALTLLKEARVEGALVWTAIEGLDADVRARTERSSLHVLAKAALDQSVSGTIEGDLAIAELVSGPDAVARCDAKLAGTVRAPRTFGTLRSARIGPASDAQIDFDVDAKGVVVRGNVALEGERVEIDGTATLTGTFEGTCRVASAEIEAAGSRERVTLRFADAPARVAELALRLANVSVRVPGDARWTGELAIIPHGAIEGDLGVETASSALVSRVKIAADRSLVGTTLRGRFSFADANALGLFGKSVRPRPDGAMQLKGVVEGSLTAPVLHVDAESASVELELPTIEPLPLRQVSARLTVDRARLVIRSLAARLLSGELACEALVGWTPAFDGMQWRVRCDGVAIDTIALRGGRTLNAWISGRLSATLTLDSRGDGPLVGGGELRIDAPIYLALALLAPTLARHGLSTPSNVGVSPLVARFGFGERGVRFEGIDARLDGVTVNGWTTIDWDRTLNGRIDAQLAERVVRNSALLGIPAMFANTIPLAVDLSGTLDDPRTRIDPLRTLGVADAVDSITSALGDLFAPARPAQPDPGIDAILDRILDRDPRSEQLIAQLVDRGIDPDEFERMLARRRAARRR